MLSLRRYIEISEEGPDVRLELVRAIALLLEALALKLPVFDVADHERFQHAIRKVRQEIENSESASETVALTGSAVRSIQAYAQDLARTVASEKHELKSIASMLTQALVRVAEASETCVGQLSAVERELAHASELNDVRHIKAKLANSLEALSVETARQKHQAAAIRSELLRAAMEATDKITGLPTYEPARARIEAVLREGRTAFAALFHLECLDVVNNRFGYKAGDQLLLVFSQHIAHQLSGGDELFRWRGPLFLALLERDKPLSAVVHEVQRIARTRLEHTVTTRERNTLITMNCSFSVFQIGPEGDCEDVVNRIDGFATDRRRIS